MSYDLILGFRNKPSDLDEAMQKIGFKLREVTKAEESMGGYEVRIFYYFYEQKSHRGVELIYEDGIETGEKGDVHPLLELEPNIVAMATITTSRKRNDFDLHVQSTIATLLRDYYKAILYDPQEDRKIEEEEFDIFSKFGHTD